MISVVVPVFNMKPYLPRLMKSIQNQSERDFEVVLVDDGSNDGCSELCDLFAERKEYPITVIHQKNMGLSSARNAGIKVSSGKYIIFPDPDDFLEPDYLHILTSFSEFRSEDTNLEICNHYIHRKNKDFVNADDALIELFKKNSFGGYVWNKLFRMDIIRKYNLAFDEECKSFSDILFCVQYMSKCKSIHYTGTPLYHYDVTSGVFADNTKLNSRKASGLVNTFPKIIQEIEKNGNEDVVRASHARLFALSVKFLFQYKNSNYKDEVLLETLNDNIKKYQDDFFSSNDYSRKEKIYGYIAITNESLFVLISQFFWRMKGE